MMDCKPFVTQQDPSSDSVERISWMPRAVWIRHREDMQGSRLTAQSVTAQPWPIPALEIRVAGTSPHFWAAFPCAGLTHSLWTHADIHLLTLEIKTHTCKSSPPCSQLCTAKACVPVLTKTSSPAAAGRDCHDRCHLAAWLAALSTSKELKINETRAFSNLIVPQLYKASCSCPDKGVG